MPDEDKKTEDTEEKIEEKLEEKLEEKQEEVKEEKVEEKEEEFLSPGIVGPSPGILEKIANVFKGKKDTEETTETEDDKIEDKVEDEEEVKSEDDETEEKKEYDEIDPRFISAAKGYGWDDKRIVDYAENHPESDVLTMVGLFESINKAQPELDKEEEQVKEELFDEETLSKYAEAFSVDKATIKGIAEKMTGPLADRLNSVSSELDAIKGNLGSKEESEQRRESVRNMDTANAIFDSSKISSLGETKDIQTYPDGSYVINDPVVQERNKVWEVANTFHAMGGTFENAVENAMQWYRGTSAEKEVKRNVIKDLKKQEERVMPKRQEQHGEKVYDSEEDRRAAVVNEALAKYNKELPS